MQTPTSLCHTSPTHTFRLLPTFTGGVNSSSSGNGNSGNNEAGRLFDTSVSGENSTFSGLPGGFILQNYSLRDDDDDDGDDIEGEEGGGGAGNNQITAMKNRLQTSTEKRDLQNPMSEQIFSKSLANNLHCENKLCETTEMTQSFSSLKRTAISLEELNDYKDETNSRNYSRLVRFQLTQDEIAANDDPVNCVHIPNRSEYQTLTSFHRDEEKYSPNPNTSLSSSWIKHNQAEDESSQAFSNPYDQLNCKVRFKPFKTTTNNNNNSTFKNNHTTNNGSNSNTTNNTINSSLFQDFFQLQPLTSNQHSEGNTNKTGSSETTSKSDDFYLANDIHRSDNDFFQINKTVTKLSKLNPVSDCSTVDCMHNMTNCNRTHNDNNNKSSNNSNNKSPSKSSEDKKLLKSIRQPKVVTLISPKKEPTITMNETQCLFTDKGNGLVNKSLNTEGSFV
ncbi:unnamed protein product [Trichobilharzia szidati]|nr:unnamed protein product [Trichobilharzia szidati]